MFNKDARRFSLPPESPIEQVERNGVPKMTNTDLNISGAPPVIPLQAGPPRAAVPDENPVAVYDAVTNFFDLSAPSRGLHKIYDQPPGFMESFLAQLAQLILRGVVGTETIVEGAETRERFLTVGIGDHAPLARRLDVRV